MPYDEFVCPICGGDPDKQRVLLDPDDHGNLNRETCCDHAYREYQARMRYKKAVLESESLGESVVKGVFGLMARLLK